MRQRSRGVIPCGVSLLSYSLILFCFLSAAGRCDTHKGKPLWLSINNILTIVNTILTIV